LEVMLAGGPSLGAGIGVATATVFSGAYLGDSLGTLGWYSDGQFDNNNSIVTHLATFNPASARLCFALDLDNKKIWGRVGTTGNWNNDVIANQNPASNTGGVALPSALQSDVCPAANLKALTPTPDSITGVFAAGSFAGTPPSGFSAFS